MKTDQAIITQTINLAAIKAVNAAVKEMMSLREDSTSGWRNKAASVRPKIGGPLLKQWKFNWSCLD